MSCYIYQDMDIFISLLNLQHFVNVLLAHNIYYSIHTYNMETEYDLDLEIESLVVKSDKLN